MKRRGSLDSKRNIAAAASKPSNPRRPWPEIAKPSVRHFISALVSVKRQKKMVFEKLSRFSKWPGKGRALTSPAGIYTLAAPGIAERPACRSSPRKRAPKSVCDFNRPAKCRLRHAPGFPDREGTYRDVRLESWSLLRFEPPLRHSNAAIAAGIAQLARVVVPDQRLIGAHPGSTSGGHRRAWRPGSRLSRRSRRCRLREQVAIQPVRAALKSRSTPQRFSRTRDSGAPGASARARLLDGGSASAGMPDLVMEFIEAEAITDGVSAALQREQRLRLFLEACYGVEFPHRNQAAHRDLKPVNIFGDLDGTPELLDFGIVKMLVADADSPSATTTDSATTPEYAAPEQGAASRYNESGGCVCAGSVLEPTLNRRESSAISAADSLHDRPGGLPDGPALCLRRCSRGSAAIGTASSAWPCGKNRSGPGRVPVADLARDILVSTCRDTRWRRARTP